MTDAAREALERLREGNRRFVEGGRAMRPRAGSERRRELVDGQAPFAVVVGCSDSRVPVEMVFDQGLGDLFVIRVAGNVIDPSQRGSVEYAAVALGTPLAVVLGHSGCGAVHAALQRAAGPGDELPADLATILDAIGPALEATPGAAGADPESRLRAAVRANVRAATARLRQGSETLEGMIHAGDLLVLGAEYSLVTGIVDFFDGVPENG